MFKLISLISLLLLQTLTQTAHSTRCYSINFGHGDTPFDSLSYTQKEHKGFHDSLKTINPPGVSQVEQYKGYQLGLGWHYLGFHPVRINCIGTLFFPQIIQFETDFFERNFKYFDFSQNTFLEITGQIKLLNLSPQDSFSVKAGIGLFHTWKYSQASSDRAIIKNPIGSHSSHPYYSNSIALGVIYSHQLDHFNFEVTGNCYLPFYHIDYHHHFPMTSLKVGFRKR